jgi:hypothetical protein
MIQTGCVPFMPLVCLRWSLSMYHVCWVWLIWWQRDEMKETRSKQELVETCLGCIDAYHVLQVYQRLLVTPLILPASTLHMHAYTLSLYDYVLSLSLWWRCNKPDRKVLSLPLSLSPPLERVLSTSTLSIDIYSSIQHSISP